MPTLSPITLSSERLLLRGLERSDAVDLLDLYADPQVMRYWNHAPWTTLDQAHAAIAEAQSDYASGVSLHLAIVHRSSGALLGSCALYGFVPQHRSAAIGYLLSRPHWGQGYLSEALQLLLDYGFDELGLNRIEADVDPRNEASAKALQRLSFHHEGKLREHWFVNGQVRDTALYGLLCSDWQGRSSK